jgi:MarR family multiple antibiotic resistance transcriptional regulator
MSNNLEFYGKEDKQFVDSHVVLLAKNSLMFEKLMDIRLAPLDITSSQTKILMMIGCGGYTMASTIAKRLGSNAGGVVRSLDKLEAKGWIERVRSAEDRREVHLLVTEAGQKMIDRVPLYMNDSLNESLSGFSKEEFETLKRLLTRLAENNMRQIDELEKTEIKPLELDL